MKGFGEFVGEGFVLGIKRSIGDVKTAANGLASAAVPNASAYNSPALSASTVSGTVEVESRDSAIVGAIADLRRDLTNLTVEMSGEKVGRIVAPTVSREIANEATQIKRGRGRR